MRTTRVVFAGLAALTATILGGCAPQSLPGSPMSHDAVAHSGSPTPHPTPTGLPADVLLRISGTAVADDGTRARIVETVFGPTAPDGTEDAAMDAAMCSGDGYSWKSDFPGTPQWLHLDMSAQLTEGSVWPTANGDYEIALMGGSAQTTVAWTGSWHNGQAYCSPGYAILPGHATGLAPVVGDASARTSWQTAVFGFGWDYGASETPPAHPFVTMQDCRLELSSRAEPFAANFPLAPETPGYGQSCFYGEFPS